MSEYQYYEFQTADRHLSEKEMRELRAYSTRAIITPTSFSNDYSFGSFKGNPDAWMGKYFDGFLYLANWGTHELQLALSAKLLSAKMARRYCAGDAASVREKSGKVILSFRSEDERGGEWVEGEGMLMSLLPLRSALAQGDLRILYVGWLLNVQSGEVDETDSEPPVPPNLGELFGPMSHFIDFLRVDPDLLAVAAQASPHKQARPAEFEEIAAGVARLPVQEKDGLLVRFVAGEDAMLATELRARFHRSRADHSSVPEAPRRTVRQLLAAAQAFREQRRREAERKATEEKARQERLAAIAREKLLDALAGEESELWTKVEELVSTKQPKSYDLAIQHLVDLRDLAFRKGAESDFLRRLTVFREAHSRKSSLIGRLQQKGLRT